MALFGGFAPGGWCGFGQKVSKSAENGQKRCFRGVVELLSSTRRDVFDGSTIIRRWLDDGSTSIRRVFDEYSTIIRRWLDEYSSNFFCVLFLVDNQLVMWVVKKRLNIFEKKIAKYLTDSQVVLTFVTTNSEAIMRGWKV